jgi:hypothetical protein
MKRLLLIAALASLAPAGLAPAADEAKAKGDPVEYQVYNGYFESNKSGLKGDASFLAFTDAKAFDRVFGKAVVMGKKPTFLPKDAFASKLVVAAIKRGGDIWQYKVEKVTADDGTLVVRYEATAKDGGGATFASPLIVAVDKGKYSAVEFVENGKNVGKAAIAQ